MKIKIAHFYYDLLNLYGENGNVKALKQALEQAGCDVTISFITIGDTPKFQQYDVIYMGAGTEANQKIALADLRQYKQEIKQAITDHKLFIVTGNALELFGAYIIDQDQQIHKGLEIFPYHAEEVAFRIVDEALFSSSLIRKPILGFQNQGSVIKDINAPLFNVIEGTGSYPHSHTEGIHQYEFYGTYLIGPLLVRNPKLLEYFCKKIIKQKYPQAKLKKLTFTFEEKAYQSFMKKHYPKYM